MRSSFPEGPSAQISWYKAPKAIIGIEVVWVLRPSGSCRHGFLVKMRLTVPIPSMGQQRLLRNSGNASDQMASKHSRYRTLASKIIVFIMPSFQQVPYSSIEGFRGRAYKH